MNYSLIKGLLFIAHHTASVVQIGILQYNGAEFEYLRKCVELFAWLELSAFVLNYRAILKDKHLLNANYDLFSMSIYAYIRGIVFPYYIYNYLTTKMICAIIPILIYIVSMIWLLSWYLSIKDNHRKLKDLSKSLNTSSINNNSKD